MRKLPVNVEEENCSENQLVYVKIKTKYTNFCHMLLFDES